MIKRLILLIFCATLLLSACSVKQSKDSFSNTTDVKGDRVYGGTFRLGMNESPQSLYPHKITDAASARIASQIYEGLVKFNTLDLTVIPSLAEKWEIDSSGTQYTFHLRKGVLFQDDPCFPGGKGREVKASDVKYSFELLCTASPDNLNFGVLLKDRIVGANEFYARSRKKEKPKDLSGITLSDDYTVQLKLIAPSSSFIYSLTSSAGYIVAREAVEKYGTSMKIGTGPFRVADQAKPIEQITLCRNEHYYGTDSLGNKLPFLDTLIFRFYTTKQKELEEFQNGSLSFIWGLPSESIRDMVEKQIADFNKLPPKFILDRAPEMSTQYYAFNLTKEPFKKAKVRQAFSYAIDRSAIVDNILKGEAFGPGVNGISPPSFKNYDVSKIKGFDFNPALAKQLLAEAGYPGGKGFPSVKLKLNSGGTRNANVVLEIQKQLHDVLGINIDFDIESFKEKLSDEAMGNGDIFRSAWVADYPSPENFLWLFYGKIVPENSSEPSYPNSTRYKNKAFDALFEAGKNAKKQEDAYKYFMDAERLLMQDAPIMVLWYDENWRLTKSNVHNFHGNPMTIYDFSQVFLKEPVANAQGAKK